MSVGQICRSGPQSTSATRRRDPAGGSRSDGKWYPPEQHPAAAVPAPVATVTDGSAEPVPRVAVL